MDGFGRTALLMASITNETSTFCRQSARRCAAGSSPDDMESSTKVIPSDAAVGHRQQKSYEEGTRRIWWKQDFHFSLSPQNGLVTSFSAFHSD